MAPSLSIPLGQLEERLAEVPTDADLVVFCRVGSRSARAVERLQHFGYRRVFNLEGGLEKWHE